MAENSHHYSASDYAGIVFPGGSFYFGYEVTERPPDDDEDDDGGEWCFQAKFDNGQVITIPQSRITRNVFAGPREILLDAICQLLNAGTIKIEVTDAKGT